jgi:dTDP-glucose pyrophosphorylase
MDKTDPISKTLSHLNSEKPAQLQETTDFTPEEKACYDRLAKSIIPADRSIIDALSFLNENAIGVLLIADSDYKLLGVVTDGDVRRAILARRSLDEPIETIMNRHPVTAKRSLGMRGIREKMWSKKLRHIPILDDNSHLIGLEVVGPLRHSIATPTVVIMAGGLGTRLRPLTEECPKPLIEVAGKPILEHLIIALESQGFKKIIISVNYKSEMIEQYFETGDKWDVSIEYLKETTRLGTAGSLSLIQELPDSPLLVLNGDVLTKTNFKALVQFHRENESDITVAITEMTYQVPYGVVSIDNHRLLSVNEKPKQKFFVNAGIYVISPELTELIPHNSYFDMTELVELAQEDSHVTVFPIHEYWRDVGEKASYERAQTEVGLESTHKKTPES